MLFFSLRRLKSSDESKRIEAIEQIRQSGDSRAVDHLLTASADPSSLVRMSAVDALGQLGDKRALEQILNLLQDESSGVRQSAIAAIDQLADDPAKKSVIPLLQDSDRTVRQTAANALKKLASSPEIRQALSEYDRGEQEIKRSIEEARNKRIAETKQKETEAKAELADRQMVQKLIELAAHYAGGGVDREKPWLAREVQEIGRTLYSRGGIREMERVWLKMPLVEGKRQVEAQWNGIGQWSNRWMVPETEWNKTR